MDFIDSLRQFAASAERRRAQIQTEEATKTSLILPFFQQVFGYDIFNPDEFIPEFTADIGTKKDEKVDYAIIINGEPAILIEAKWCGVTLENHILEKHNSQLYRYFGTTTAKYGILTNGIVYKFYTDLNAQNKMDLVPFLELDLLNVKESLVPELKRFCKTNFDANEIFSRASELKYSNEIRNYFLTQLENPSDEFVKFMLSCAYDGMKTAAVIEKYRPVVKSTLNTLITEMMNERIKKAMDGDKAANEPPPTAPIASDEPAPTSKIVTTDEELESFYIVKAIVSEILDPEKVRYNDTQNYFAIYYESDRNIICRVTFTPHTRRIRVFANKQAEDYPIETPKDIYKYKDVLLSISREFLQ